MTESMFGFLKKIGINKTVNRPLVTNPLVAQEEANSILEHVGRALPEGYNIDRKAIKELHKHSHDYVLTAQADKTIQAEKKSKTDKLTGLWNREAMMDEIQRAIEEVSRNGGSMHVVFMDLRFFKKFNDTYGHATGDNALLALVDGVRQHIRPYDQMGRWGGEEFILLIKNGEVNNVQKISERLHTTLSKLHKPFNEIHADMGVFSYSANDAKPVSGQELIDKADSAMYFAKKNNLKEVKVWDPSL